MVDHRQTLRANLIAALRHKKLTAKTIRAHYASGKKKGRRISARTIDYWINKIDDPQSPAPTLDGLAGLAEALDLQPWQLLVPGLDLTDPHQVTNQAERAQIEQAQADARELLQGAAAVAKRLDYLTHGHQIPPPRTPRTDHDHPSTARGKKGGVKG